MMNPNERFQLIPSTDPVLRAELATGLTSARSARTDQLAAFLAAACGATTVAVVHYGSHAQRSQPRAESAHDFFVIVDRYRDAYRALTSRGVARFGPRVATVLNRLLAPNVIRVTVPGVTPALEAKCAVYSWSDFRLAASPHARDHFALGRLFQHVQVAWTRDQESTERVIDLLIGARIATFAWGSPYLPHQFDVDAYCRVLLETSFAAEIRPEGSERVDTLLAAQRETLIPVYTALLDQLVRQRILTRNGKVYTLAAPVGKWAKFRAAMYFRRSEVRATSRWLKYIALYDDWLEYILQKIARRSGVSVELTERERRWPLIFLWPKAIRYLRSRPQRRS
ncbi:MAG TPA: hypothetical protein VGR59_16820 [Gemmatimonadaceae bacterium]|nr:hypothetical protein [Gemmatimonadaceae bacterium]